MTEQTANPKYPVTFRDATGREWKIGLTVGAAKRIKAELTLDLLAVVKPKNTVLAQLADDPEQLCEVIWRLVLPQAEALGVDQVAFWDAMDDAAIDGATQALIGCLIRFFRNRGGAIAAAMDVQDKAAAKLSATLATIGNDVDIDAAVAKIAAKMMDETKRQLSALGDRLGNSPAT
jgi:hypothetical protein